jgi:dimethylargininase
VDTLEDLGCRTIRLPASPDLPDCLFVEDTVVVLDELAILARPGAESRRPETDAVEAALAPFRPIARIREPGTLEGGDVLRIDRTLYVGLSGRTNEEGARQLREAIEPLGYCVVPVPVRGRLHLKSQVTLAAPGVLLIDPRFADRRAFPGFDFIDVAPGEDDAANGLLVSGTLVYPDDFPATRGRLDARGIAVRTVPMSEIRKAEGAVTCCSVVFSITEAGGVSVRSWSSGCCGEEGVASCTDKSFSRA